MGFPLAMVIQLPHSPKDMGSCPYCRATTESGDSICYSCGRVLANINSSNFRLEQQFNQGTLATSYKMTTKPTEKGLVQTHTGRTKNILKRRKNRFRSFVMLSLVAFIMLSPQARDQVIAQWAGIQEYIQDAVSPYHLYPIEASYTLDKTVYVSNSGANGYMIENLAIPPAVSSTQGSPYGFEYTDGQNPESPTSIQITTAISISFGSEEYSIPTNGFPIRTAAEKLVTSNGHEIWWPGVGSNDDFCSVSNCVKVKVNLAPGESSSFTYSVGVHSTSYSWHEGMRVDSRIAGNENGINVDNSGVFSDLAERDSGQKYIDFGDDLWYNRGSPAGYAINAQAEVILSTVETISAGIPEGLQDNAYAFSRAAFDYLHKNIAYDKLAPVVARSGPSCLNDGQGDCDEQTNAFLSLLRVKGIPGWFVFGALTDINYEIWEAHAWGYIQLPMSDEWCDENNIERNSCFVNGAVDVVNNKWLLNTPTGYIDWIEEADETATKLNNFYHPISQTNGIERERSYSTGNFELEGVNYKVSKYAETFW